MNDNTNKANRRILLIGFGNLGQSLAPLLLRHIDWVKPSSLHVVTADTRGMEEAYALGIGFDIIPLTSHNYAEVLQRYLRADDILINVSVDVSSLDLIKWCQCTDVLYIDTCIEPWAGFYTDPSIPVAARTNYALREAALNLASPGKPTAVVAHGANPGLVSHFLKTALRDLATQRDIDPNESYARLAQRLGVRAIHIAERDTQSDGRRRLPGTFVNTWSVDGLMSEARQCAELGWGTHETNVPAEAGWHVAGSRAGIFLLQPGAATRVRSWVPSAGEQAAYLITHHESLSIADFLTVRSDWGAPVYRPTVFYAYRPCNVTCESIEEWRQAEFAEPTAKWTMRNSITSGFDELGVLLVFDQGAYWYGSTLSHAHAAALSPYNNATTLQVTAAMLGAIEWLLANPRAGVVEAEQLDHEVVLAHAQPYLGEVTGVHTNWTPAAHGTPVFADFLG